MSTTIYTPRHPSHKYIRWYVNLVRTRISNPSKSYPIQKHHYFPICVFGNRAVNKSTVKLTAREHFVAHKLLCKIFQLRHGFDSKKFHKIQRAFIGMRFNIHGDSMSSRMIDEIAVTTRKLQSDGMRGDNNPSRKYGIGEEHRRKLSLIGKGRPHSKEHIKHIKQSHEIRKSRGDVYFSEDSRQKSIEVCKAKASRYDFYHPELNIHETYITCPELVSRYPNLKLDASNLRKSNTSKGWKKTRIY